jgi:ATP adenylyltransferase
MTKFQRNHSRRFSNLLSRNSRDIWDTVLYEDDDVVVVPTLGSLVPDWLLVVPKTHVLNFSIWSGARGRNALQLVEAVHHRLSNGSPAIWFEHGASEQGSEVGCGVDHAHIHLLLQPSFTLSSFCQTVGELSQIDWSQEDAKSLYSLPVAKAHYYAFGDFDHAYVHVGHTLGRQFFRKIVAQLAGCPDQWDYRDFSGLENVNLTVSRFLGSAEIAA